MHSPKQYSTNAINDIKVINAGDDFYPKKVSELLRSKAPKCLHYIGNLSLLEMKGVGLCGSRKASPKGLETAADCASQIAAEKVVVISGYAAGVDMMAHATALQNGGYTIFVLPEGINNFKIKPELRSIWDWSRVLVLSQYDPQATWQAFRAMERNLLIIALSDAMVVIEAGITGGTISAGKSTLKLGRPLYVASYDNEYMSLNATGNIQLLKDGAHKLCKSNLTKKAKLSKLLGDIMNNYQQYDLQKSLL